MKTKIEVEKEAIKYLKNNRELLFKAMFALRVENKVPKCYTYQIRPIIGG